uniref:Uncharacterized protein n=1 Tax=Salix viminalis TaxID=40686 RepID=A0A6N2KX69_SALVM
MTSFSLSSKAYTARDFILEAKKNPQTTFSSYFVFDRNSGWVKFRTTTTTNKYKGTTWRVLHAYRHPNEQLHQ